MVTGIRARSVARGAAAVGLALALFSARAAAPDAAAGTGPIPPEVLSEARAALSSARAAMNGEIAPDAAFTPSRFPNVRKRSVPRAEYSRQMVMLPGLPFPVALPLLMPVGEERPAATGGVILIPDVATLPLTAATLPAPAEKESTHADR